ncbi:hypothetical protein FGB62_116g015 [Gracilaria domingensis]|nr:hypothetical protein FGB62_116g015 [Gracilaria domingensis]
MCEVRVLHYGLESEHLRELVLHREHVEPALTFLDTTRDKIIAIELGLHQVILPVDLGLGYMHVSTGGNRQAGRYVARIVGLRCAHDLNDIGRKFDSGRRAVWTAKYRAISGKEDVDLRHVDALWMSSRSESACAALDDD